MDRRTDGWLAEGFNLGVRVVEFQPAVPAITGISVSAAVMLSLGGETDSLSNPDPHPACRWVGEHWEGVVEERSYCHL